MGYSKILAVLSDVYALGGPEVFEAFERKEEGRNLVILPADMVPQIMNPARYLGLTGIGGKDAIAAINSAISREPIQDSDGKNYGKLYHMSDNLDVAVILDENGNSPFPITPGLNDRVSSLWGRGIDKVITTNPEWTLRADLLNYPVERPGFLMVDSTVVDRGIVNGRNSLLERLYSALNNPSDHSVPAEEASELLNNEVLYPNQFIRFPKAEGHVYARVIGELVRVKGRVQHEVENLRVELIQEGRPLDKLMRIGRDHPRKTIMGYTPRDDEQYLAVQYGLLKRGNQALFLAGKAGCGKTILAYALGVDGVTFPKDESVRERREMVERRRFEQILLLKSNDLIGGEERNLGFLKGNLFAKMYPNLKSFEDAHVLLFGDELPFLEMFTHPRHKNQVSEDKRLSDLVGGGYLPETMEAVELTTLAYMRGRTISRRYIICDETQNLTPYEAKTLLERVGEDSQIIFLGDPDQFDNPHCSRDINGFTYLLKHILPSPLTTLVKLSHFYRSELSELASKLRVYSR